MFFLRENSIIKAHIRKGGIRIDCDKEFVVCHIGYDDCMKATTRPNVSVDVMGSAEKEFFLYRFDTYGTNEGELIKLNELANRIT